jgi:hypothetical protein
VSYSWEHGERRGSSRFPIERAILFRSLGRKAESEEGKGTTINMSSTGVLFKTDADVTPGRRVELSISWPAQLNEACPLKLVAKGRIVRAGSGEAALEIQQYEFRTLGSAGFPV